MFRKPLNFLSKLESLERSRKRKPEDNPGGVLKRLASTCDAEDDTTSMSSHIETRVYSALPSKEKNDLVLPSMRMALKDLHSRRERTFSEDQSKQAPTGTPRCELHRMHGHSAPIEDLHAFSDMRPAFLHRQQSQPKRTPTETFTVMCRKSAQRQGTLHSDDYMIFSEPKRTPPRINPSALVPIPAKRPLSSKYKGVSWNREKGKWAVYLSIDGVYTYLGRFDDEEEAARKYDLHAAFLGKQTNFPVVRNIEFDMRYIGVSWNRSSKKWVASIEAGEGAVEFLGLFENQLDAARKYDVHAGRIGLPTNFAQQNDNYADEAHNRTRQRISEDDNRVLQDSGNNEMPSRINPEVCWKNASPYEALCQLTQREQIIQSQGRSTKEQQRQYKEIISPYGTWQEHQQRQSLNQGMQHEDPQQQKYQKEEEKEIQQPWGPQLVQYQQQQDQQQENRLHEHQRLQSQVESSAAV